MNRTGSWVWDVHRGEPVYWSAEMCRLHGRRVELGPPSVDEYRSLHGPDGWAAWTNAIETSIRERTELSLDCELLLPDGSARGVRITGRPIAGAAATVTEVVGTATPITDQQPDTAHENEEDVRLAIDAIPALI